MCKNQGEVNRWIDAYYCEGAYGRAIIDPIIDRQCMDFKKKDIPAKAVTLYPYSA